jgi:predicted dehydrogenase
LTPGRVGKGTTADSGDHADGVAEVRVAVVGLGLIGRERAEALERIEGAVLTATVDPVASSPFDGAGVPHHRSLEELSPDSYDCAVVAVPHDVAVDIARMLLQAGRPILIEKPLGVRSADARELEALAAGLERPSFVGFNYRYLPAIAELLRLVDSGELGRLRNLDLLVGHGGNPRSGEGWKLDPVRAGGGVLLDPGVHLLDLLLLLGPSGVRCTNIEATRGFWPTGIEEDVVAGFRHGSMIGTVRASHIRWVNTFRVELFGDDGYAIAEGRGGNYGAMTLRIGRRWGWMEAGVGQRDSEQTENFGELNDSLHDELMDVVACWRGAIPGKRWPRPATMSEARAVTELCERLYARMS